MAKCNITCIDIAIEDLSLEMYGVSIFASFREKQTLGPFNWSVNDQFKEWPNIFWYWGNPLPCLFNLISTLFWSNLLQKNVCCREICQLPFIRSALRAREDDKHFIYIRLFILWMNTSIRAPWLQFSASALKILKMRLKSLCPKVCRWEVRVEALIFIWLPTFDFFARFHAASLETEVSNYSHRLSFLSTPGL